VAHPTTFQTYLARGHKKKRWVMLSSCPQSKQLLVQLPPLFNKISIVRILFFRINHMKVLTRTGILIFHIKLKGTAP
jgi:hypothetical protein